MTSELYLDMDDIADVQKNRGAPYCQSSHIQPQTERASSIYIRAIIKRKSKAGINLDL